MIIEDESSRDDAPPRYRAPERRRRMGSESRQVLLAVAAIAVTGGLLSLQLSRSMRDDRIAVEAMLSQVRQAVAAEVSRQQAAGRGSHLAALAGSNPFRLIQPRPEGYKGEFRERSDRPDPGHWYFDLRLRDMAYRVRDPAALQTEGPFPDEVRFHLALVHEDRDGNGRFDPLSETARSVELRPRYAYRWSGGSAP